MPLIFLTCWLLFMRQVLSHYPPPVESHRGLYVALVYTSANEVAVNKLNRTLATMATELSAATNTLISPLLIPLSSFFTGFHDVHSALLNKTVITTVVLAPDSPGLLPALSSLERQVPLFWATGQVLHGYLERESLGVFEIRLEAGLHEVFQGLRSLLMVTHWHSFTLIHTTLPFTSSLLNVISKPPLSPQIVPLRPNASPYAIFRMLSEISRATKGVVLLMSDGKVTKKVMDEAKRLHMVDGDFVWIWIDTSAAVSANLNSSKQHIDNDAVEMITETREKRSKPGPFRSFESNSTFVRNKRRRFVFFHDDFVNKRHPLPSSSPASTSYFPHSNYSLPPLPVGLLAVKALPMKIDKHFVRATMRMVFESMRKTYLRYCNSNHPASESCFKSSSVFSETNFTQLLFREMRHVTHEALSGRKNESSLVTRFQILNLVPSSPLQTSNISESTSWRPVGEIIGHSDVRLETIVWPGGELVPASTTKGARSIFRVVTALAPPFVMEGELDEDGQCLRGLECHRLLTSGKDNLTLVFNEMEKFEDDEEEVDKLTRAREIWSFGRSNVFHHSRYRYRTNCCYGLSMDLLENIAQELEFDFHLYIVADGLFGSKVRENQKDKWSGVVGDLATGTAHMSFAALSVSSTRSEVIDYTVPYFYSGVSFLAAPKHTTDIPLLAFLLPFSFELWIAIFTSLHVTAVAVAIYEWHSPFGLNPWGRQRSKNFTMASALWAMWGLLCGHLVQYKAPKSWPNKFLINVWGGFSVIFVASYTANIAALIAGLFFVSGVGDQNDRSLLSQRVATAKASAAEYYIHRTNQLLWEHMQRFKVNTVAEGVQKLKNGSLDILIADTPILDYYRATDHGCKLQKIGESINDDTYAVGLTKGFPLKDSISAVISKYSNNGYMDILQEKWYGGLPCFKLDTDMDMAQPKPLGVAAVAGVFLLLGVGVVAGCAILCMEHLFYKYTLPILRLKPKGTIWRSRNVMFFSQKLYRFINCVELVSPHHAARELVQSLRQGQITSLFQKNVKADQDTSRRRKSKAQFFEMIQEIRRVQQAEKQENKEITSPSKQKKQNRAKSPQVLLSPPELIKQHRRLSPSKLDFARRLSKDFFRSKSSGNLNTSRRMSIDVNLATGRFLDFQSAQTIGRRLSHGVANSPPDVNSRRSSALTPRRESSPEPIQECEQEPTTPKPNLLLPRGPSSTSLTPKYDTSPRSPSSRNFPAIPSRDIGSAAKKFSYVDVNSSSFKNKISKIQKHDSSSSKEMDTLAVSPNNRPQDSTINISEDCNLNRENWANVSGKSVEHIIEISIPDDNGSKLEVKKSNKKSDRANNVSKGTKEKQKKTHVSDQGDAKPKIVSYIPRKPEAENSNDSNNSEHDLPKPESPLQKLSREELLHLVETPELELKNSILEALRYKDPT
uniref:Glutamate receptor ionotropic, NMDA 3A n=2 Tax=Cacopsylla melanoneura TaxID=428564 RepID=A0A8D8RZG8_9HEMI